jgi:tetratricopeptide (TPR) repeat protein
MNGFEQRLARAWPRLHQLNLSGLAGLAIMTWPGPGLDYWSDGDMAARLRLHQTVLADLPRGWVTRAARVRLLLGLGALCSLDHSYAQAINWTQQALTLTEQMRDRARSADCCFRLGRAYFVLRRYAEALAAFQRGLDISPRYRGAHTWMGYTFAALNRHAEALAAYQQAIEMHPDDPTPHEGVGQSYIDLGRYNDAVVAYQWATEIAPDRAYPYKRLGNIYHHLKRYAEAEAAYRRAVQLDPDDPEPYSVLGNLAASQSHYAQALEWYQKAMEKQIDPHERVILRLGLGKVQQMLEQYDAAVDTLALAVKAEPELMYGYLELGACYRKLGREAEAAEPLQTARRLIGADDAYNWACLESICGHTDEALVWLKTALDREPARREWAQEDRDFDFIRETPRFGAIIGPAPKVADS